jgi:hypothetical protein
VSLAPLLGPAQSPTGKPFSRVADTPAVNSMAGWSANSRLTEAIPSHLAGAAKLVAACRVVLLDDAIDGPGFANRQVRGRHRVQMIRRTGTTPGGMGSRRRRVLESAAEPRFRTPLTVRGLA